MGRNRWYVVLGLLLLLLPAWRFNQSSTPYAFPPMSKFPEMPLAADNLVTEEGVALGRALFYDPILSRDSSIACASCHRQATAFADGGRAFSLGIQQQAMKRNTPALFNLAWNEALFWDGRAPSPEAQVFHPVRDAAEMNLSWPEAEARLRGSSFYKPMFRAAFGNAPIDSVHIARAIAQFERTLLSSNSKYDRVLRGEDQFTEDEYQGMVIANDQSMADCLHCHPTDGSRLGTTGTFSNNGLLAATTAEGYPDAGRAVVTGNPAHAGQFKIPSLRNVALTAPYMHDGRFKTLEAVIDFYSEGVQAGVNTDPKMQFAHQGGVHLTDEQKRQLLAFLHTLTDSVFISNPAHGNPFR